MLGASEWRLKLRKNYFKKYAVKSHSKLGLNRAMILIYLSIWHDGGVDFVYWFVLIVIDGVLLVGLRDGSLLSSQPSLLVIKCLSWGMPLYFVGWLSLGS